MVVGDSMRIRSLELPSQNGGGHDPRSNDERCDDQDNLQWSGEGHRDLLLPERARPHSAQCFLWARRPPRNVSLRRVVSMKISVHFGWIELWRTLRDRMAIWNGLSSFFLSQILHSLHTFCGSGISPKIRRGSSFCRGKWQKLLKTR